MRLFTHREEHDVWKLYPQWCLSNHLLGMEHRAWANRKLVGKRGRGGVTGHSDAKESDPGGELQERPRVRLYSTCTWKSCSGNEASCTRQTLVPSPEGLWSIHCRALLASGGRTSCFQGPQEVYAAFQRSSVSNRTLIYFSLFTSSSCLVFASPMSIPYIGGTQDVLSYSTFLSCICAQREFIWMDIMCEAILGNDIRKSIYRGTSFLGG